MARPCVAGPSPTSSKLTPHMVLKYMITSERSVLEVGIVNYYLSVK